MSDFLLELSQNPTAKRLIQSAGLPIPMPSVLERPRGAATEQVLKDRLVIAGGEGDLFQCLPPASRERLEEELVDRVILKWTEERPDDVEHSSR